MDKISLFKKLMQMGIKPQGPIKIWEVGPRDGLQNQEGLISLMDKKKFIQKIQQTGIKNIQVGSFVSAKWVPQMSNTKQLYQQLQKRQDITYSCLVPNDKGLNDALQAKVNQIAIFASATEGFSKKNLNCSIQQSFKRFQPVLQKAKANNIKVRGYVSMVLGCPYDGQVKPSKVKEVVQRLLQMGCYQVSLGDTIGKGTSNSLSLLLEHLTTLNKSKLALHFHDTYGNALQNILIAYSKGYRIFDCSVAGIGGCPYAKTSIGNVCTENVVQMFQKIGVNTGIDVDELAKAGQFMCKLLNRQSSYIKV